jgi:Uma2 family endonuclease
MVVKSAMPIAFDSFAELHARLGYVPLNRICMNPAPGTATEADLVRFLEAANKRLYELIDRTLVEKAVGMRESMIAAKLIQRLANHVEEHDLGLVAGADGPFRLLPGLVRLPDVSFIRWQDVPNESLPDETLSTLTASLVVEVLSSSNTAAEIARKRDQFFSHGCKQFWVVDHETQTVDVFTSITRVKSLSTTDTLDGGKILPGFSMQVVDLFTLERRKPGKKKG